MQKMAAHRLSKKWVVFSNVGSFFGLFSIKKDNEPGYIQITARNREEDELVAIKLDAGNVRELISYLEDQLEGME